MEFVTVSEKEKKQRAAFLANSVVGSMSSLQTKKRRAHLEDLIDEAEKVEFARLEKEHLNNFPSPKDKNGLGLIPKVSIPRPNNCGLKLAVLDQPTTKYLVLYDYEASNNDELNLVKGDLINVVEACEDGWCVGTCERTGLFGTFPGNYAVTKKSESVDLWIAIIFYHFGSCWSKRLNHLYPKLHKRQAFCFRLQIFPVVLHADVINLVSGDNQLHISINHQWLNAVH